MRRQMIKHAAWPTESVTNVDIAKGIIEKAKEASELMQEPYHERSLI